MKKIAVVLFVGLFFLSINSFVFAAPAEYTLDDFITQHGNKMKLTITKDKTPFTGSIESKEGGIYEKRLFCPPEAHGDEKRPPFSYFRVQEFASYTTPWTSFPFKLLVHESRLESLHNLGLQYGNIRYLIEPKFEAMKRGNHYIFSFVVKKGRGKGELNQCEYKTEALELPHKTVFGSPPVIRVDSVNELFPKCGIRFKAANWKDDGALMFGAIIPRNDYIIIDDIDFSREATLELVEEFSKQNIDKTLQKYVKQVLQGRQPPRDRDRDGDGVVDSEDRSNGIDCSNDPERFPGNSEECNGIDDDCDGDTDEGFNIGGSCAVGKGQCRRTGTIQCTQHGTAECSAVPGTSRTEDCTDGLDNDCDGKTDAEDTDCGECSPDETQSCYSGSSYTKGVGICKSGTQTCNQQREWGSCEGEVLPRQEKCGDNLDNDCDGEADEGCDQEEQLDSFKLRFYFKEEPVKGADESDFEWVEKVAHSWYCGENWENKSKPELKEIIYGEYCSKHFKMVDVTDSSEIYCEATQKYKESGHPWVIECGKGNNKVKYDHDYTWFFDYVKNCDSKDSKEVEIKAKIHIDSEGKIKKG